MNPDRLRVALLSLHFAEYASLLAPELAKSCDVLLLLSGKNADEELGADWQGRLGGGSARVVSLPKAKTPHAIVFNAWRVSRELRAFRPDVIHVQEAYGDELIPALLRYHRKAIVLTVHDPQPHSGRDARSLRFSRHRLYRALVRRLCTMAISHGDALCSALVKSDGHLRKRVFPIPHGPLGPAPASSAQEWVPGNLLFFGRIHAYKGLGDFISAVERVAATGLAIRAVIAGTGTDLDNYRARIERSPLFDVRERFIPPQEVDELFRSANVVVLPYTDGTQSGVAAMALGYGRPVIASRVGAIPELVRDGVNGLLVPPRSPDALAAAIVRVVSDPGFSRRLAENARQLAATDLSWPTIAGKTVSLYRTAVASASRRGRTQRV